jgi:hypothetical protein
MPKKRITKEEANKAQSVVINYAKQEAKAHLKEGAHVTKKAVSKYAKKGFEKMKGYFS